MRQGVKARDGLVQHQQVRPLAHGEGQGELRALPARKLPGPLPRIESEPSDPSNASMFFLYWFGWSC